MSGAFEHSALLGNLWLVYIWPLAGKYVVSMASILRCTPLPFPSINLPYAHNMECSNPDKIDCMLVISIFKQFPQ